MGTYIDGLPPETAHQVTVHHLLIHSSGLGDHMELRGFLDAARSWTSEDEAMRETLEAIRQMRPTFPSGAGILYSNAAFCLALS